MPQLRENNLYFSPDGYEMVKIFGEEGWKGVDLKVFDLEVPKVEDFKMLIIDRS